MAKKRCKIVFLYYSDKITKHKNLRGIKMRYVSGIFDQSKVNIYDTTNTKYEVTDTETNEVVIMSAGMLYAENLISQIRGVVASNNRVFNYTDSLAVEGLAVKHKILGLIDDFKLDRDGVILPIYIERSIARIPDWVERVDVYSFVYSKNIREVYCGKGVKSISKDAFSRHTSLEKIVLNTGVTILDEYCFRETSIKEIVIPNTVTEIRKGAFFNCSSLEKVTLSKSISRIDEYVFDGCPSLRSINLPKQFKDLASSIFYTHLALEQETVDNLYSIIFDK